MALRRPATSLAVAVALALTLGACGGTIRSHTVTAPPPPGLGFPGLATKNTTRVPSTDPAAVAAAVALAVFPSAAPGTHPTAVALAPSDDWQAALAAASLMGAPFHVPLLLSGRTALAPSTAAALNTLAPTGAARLGGVQAIRIGDVPDLPKLRAFPLRGSGPYALAAAIDAFEARFRGRYAYSVVIASAQAPAYAMPAAGWAAESGEPILYVNAHGVPAATAADLRRHDPARLRMYVLGPPKVIPAAVMTELRRYGRVRRVGAADPAANSVAFAEYRDPACAYGQPCVHVPRSFGWAIRSPGHGYVLIRSTDTLDAAAAAALSGSGSYGPQLLLDDPNNLPGSVLNYFLNYATPGYTSEGPTAAVYNHAWLIGDAREISVTLQAQVDSLLEAVPQR
jgi:hypothetical protein